MGARILFLANHRPNRSPSQRFRFEQYLPFLKARGFECHLSPLIRSAADDCVFYAQGRHVAKAGILARSVWTRLADWRQFDTYDIVFVHREALMTGQTVFERLLRRARPRVIFDFDDAIWLPAVSAGNRSLQWLKNPAKTPRLIAWADMVFAGNRFLADYASRYSRCVRIVPTTVDTDVFGPVRCESPPDRPVEIGWTGSPSTIEHLTHALPVLRRLRGKYGERIRFKVVGDASFRDEALGVQGVAWQSETEVRDLSTMDIGIMPLPDNEWTRGKCGFKGLTYMAMGLPTVMSPVGVNTDIVQDGINGCLAAGDEDWMDRLSALVDSPQLRARLGAAGRQTVVDRYSVTSQRATYVAHFAELLDRPRK